MDRGRKPGCLRIHETCRRSFIAAAVAVSMLAVLSGCGDTEIGEGNVIFQTGGQTITYSRSEFDRLVAAGEIDPNTGLPITDGREDGEETYSGSEPDNKGEGLVQGSDASGDFAQGSDKKGDFVQENDEKGGSSQGKAPSQALSITPSEVSKVRYAKVTGPEGYFTCEAPEGWRVTTGMKPNGKFDLLSYAITIYDPANPDRQVYYNLSCVNLKSEGAKEWYKKYGMSDEFNDMAVIDKADTETFFKEMGDYYGYKNFTVKEKLKKNLYGGDVLSAGCTSLSSGKKLSGIFSAFLVDDLEYMVKADPTQFYTNDYVDAGTRTAYTIIMETAPEDEFFDWQPVLDHCLDSISFSKQFESERRDLWRAVGAVGEYIMRTGGEVSDMIMESYNYRNRTQDVESQKYSDATLGYERVLDTDTGDYYKAEIGFSDWYDGTRYKPVDDDTAYLSPIEGYINWK